jgi:hypothetical protein
MVGTPLILDLASKFNKYIFELLLNNDAANDNLETLQKNSIHMKCCFLLMNTIIL